jgi:hypothetical protein
MRYLGGIRVVALALTLAPWASAQAGVRIGIGIGIPLGCYGYPCYAPYPVYAAPVIYPAAPVYVAAPTYPPAYAAAPAPAPAPATAAVPSDTARVSAPAPSPSLTPVAQRSSFVPAGAGQGEVDAALQQLARGDERGRAAAAVQLGRLRAGGAVESLTQALERDASPVVREAAARGLGLIATPSSLTALQRAALADEDREVRHSASFAADVIRSQLRQR